MSNDNNLGAGLGNQHQHNFFDTLNTQPVINNTDNSSVNSVTKTGQPTKDTIESESILIASLILPQLQQLTVPIAAPNLSNAAAIEQLSMDKICLNVLNNWSKQVAESAEEIRENEKQERLHPTAAAILEVHAAGLIASIAIIFVRAVFGNAVASAIDKTAANPDDKTIAQRFGSQLANWSQQGTIKGYLATIVDQLPTLANASEGVKALVSKQLEVFVLTSAVTAIYKADTKWVTHEEIFSLLRDPSKIQDPTMRTLATLLNEDLNSLPLSSKNKILNTVKAYMDSNPDLPALLDLDKSVGVQLSIFGNTRE